MAAERDPVFTTGVWLGAAQVLLAHAMLVSVGASALAYFALLAGWIAAGALGASLVDRSRDAAHFVAALVALVLTRALASVLPFSTAMLLGSLVCCGLCGSYAGFFIARAGRHADDRARFLLRENNGFVLGFAAASVLLFASVRAVDAFVLVGGLGLAVYKVRR